MYLYTKINGARVSPLCRLLLTVTWWQTLKKTCCDIPKHCQHFLSDKKVTFKHFYHKSQHLRTFCKRHFMCSEWERCLKADGWSTRAARHPEASWVWQKPTVQLNQTLRVLVPTASQSVLTSALNSTEKLEHAMMKKKKRNTSIRVNLLVYFSIPPVALILSHFIQIYGYSFPPYTVSMVILVVKDWLSLNKSSQFYFFKYKSLTDYILQYKVTTPTCETKLLQKHQNVTGYIPV